MKKQLVAKRTVVRVCWASARACRRMKKQLVATRTMVRVCWAKELILIGKGLFTKIACMIHGMLQNMVQEHFVRSIGRGAVQFETDLTCEALPGASEGNILICKGLFAKVACMIDGMLQNMVQE